MSIKIKKTQNSLKRVLSYLENYRIFFTQNDEDHQIQYFNNYITPQIYENGYDEIVSVYIVKILAHL